MNNDLHFVQYSKPEVLQVEGLVFLKNTIVYREDFLAKTTSSNRTEQKRFQLSLGIRFAIFLDCKILRKLSEQQII